MSESKLLRAAITDAELRRIRVAAVTRGEPIGVFIARCLSRGYNVVTGERLTPPEDNGKGTE